MFRRSYIISIICGCLLLCGCKNSAAEKSGSDLPLDPTLTPAAAEEAPPGREATQNEKDEAVAVMLDLYQSYYDKDLDKLMGLIHDFVEKSAADYAADHPDDKEAAEKIRDAYLAFHEDLLNHEDYYIEDFHPEFADFFVRDDGIIEVISSVPIISTPTLSFEDDDGNVYSVRLRLGRFLLKKAGDTWRIYEMDLF